MNDASANIFSLLMIAKATGLEPYGYLRHLFEQLLQGAPLGNLESLLPWRVDRTRLIYAALGDVA